MSRVRRFATPRRVLMVWPLLPGIVIRWFLGSRSTLKLSRMGLGADGGRRLPDDRSEGQVHSQHLHNGVMQDLRVITGSEIFPGSDIRESQGGLIAVNLKHLGVLIEDHPCDTSAILDGFEDLRPLATQGGDVYGIVGATALFGGRLLRLGRWGVLTIPLRRLVVLRSGLLALTG